MRSILPALVVTALLLAPVAAHAHVTVQPSTAPVDGFTRLDVRVPNERDDAGTTKVDMRLPPGFISASYEPVPGWTVRLRRSKLDKPVDAGEGFKVDEQVSQITWTGDGKQGIIKPGQFQDFGLSVRIPDGNPGDKLTFKALQTYQGGEVVRWIAPENADEPAPTVTLEAAGEGGGHGAPATGTADAQQQGATAAARPDRAADDGRSDTLSIVALGVGALALIAALAALAHARRAGTPTPRPAEEVAA